MIHSEARLALEMEQKLNEEVQAMSDKFEKQLKRMQDKNQRKLEREANKAAKAVAEWHALELELAQTKVGDRPPLPLGRVVRT